MGEAGVKKASFCYRLGLVKPLFMEIIFVRNVHFNFKLEVVL
jgi:hypothetical protein